MGMLAESFIRVRAQSTVKKDVERDTHGLGKSGKAAGAVYGKGFSFSATKAIGAIGGLLAAAGAASFFKGAIEEAREAAKVTRMTNAVLKSTGGAANISARGVEALAQRLSQKAAVDDEVIQSGANLLLTFTKVRNEAGKGNDIFNQGIGIATDMSAALGQDMKSSVIQLGKALNDPVKGVTALQRVGVSFTAKQKEQIKAMVESGNVMGAQKLILKELKTEFGGAAAAAADPAERAKVAWGNFKEEIGGFVLPIIAKLGEFLTSKVIPAVKQFIDGIRGLGDSGSIFNQLGRGIYGFIEAFKGEGVTSDGFIGRMERLGVTARKVFDYIKDSVIPTIGRFISWLAQGSTGAELLKAALVGIAAGYVVFRVITTLTRAWAAAQAALNVVMSMNPIGLIIVALVALAAGLIYAYKHSETFRNIVNAAWNGIKAVAGAVWNGFLKPVFTSFVDFLKTVGGWAMWLWQNAILPAWNGIKTAVSVAWVIVKAVFEGIRWFVQKILAPIFNWLWSVVKFAFAGIKVAIQVAWILIQIPLRALWLFITKVLGPVFSWLWRNVIIPVWNGIKAAIRAAWNFVKPIFDAVAGFLRRTLGPAFNWLWRNVITPVWNGIKNVISTVWNRGIWPIFRTVRDVITKTIPNAFRSGVDAVSRFWHGLQELVRKPINWVISYVINRGIIESINKVKKWLGIGGKPIGWLPTIGGAPARAAMPGRGSTAGLARGGVLPGYQPGKDTVPAMLSKGEAVMRPEWVRAVGKRNIDRWNRKARMGYYAKGGVVGGMPPVGGPLDHFDELMSIFGDAGKWLAKKVGLDRIADKIKASPMLDIVKGMGKKIFDFGVEKLKSFMDFFDFGGDSYLGRDPRGSVAAILAVAKRFFSGARVSSGYRRSNDYHGRGLAADLIGGGAAGMARMARGFYGMFGRLIELIHSGGGGFFVKNGRRVGASYYRSVIGQHYNHVHVAARRDALAGVGAAVQFGGGGRLGSWIRQAMAITRAPGGWFRALYNLAMHESSGNPLAQNNWDANARRGTPSKGLFQLIQPTFNRHHAPGLTNIWNAVHNGAAAIRYIRSRYRSIYNIPSYRSGDRFVGGYRDGGLVPKTGLAYVHKGEDITPAWERRAELDRLDKLVEQMKELVRAARQIGPDVGKQINSSAQVTRVMSRQGAV